MTSLIISILLNLVLSGNTTTTSETTTKATTKDKATTEQTITAFGGTGTWNDVE
ncbi:hypothetical protein ACFSKU_03990 [Pontibacter silvestris]|uniref:Uncharacterized protein n=1 Tax=Pontibacter silvestris TaxID=2305183 RepID=A0ABW4WV18_9BACT|nr:hypothetical protein [Pontibacter silvestris]MCC9137975.1 hypothetical protein [Pontibacter silvestris]